MSDCSNHACGCTGSAHLNASPALDDLVLRIDKMDCPTEESLIRNRLEGMTGIVCLNFNLMQGRLAIRHRLGDPAPVVDAIRTLGMEAVVDHGERAKLVQRDVFNIENMDCPTEDGLIRNKLSGLPEITGWSSI